jgi:hypothetical protein
MSISGYILKITAAQLRELLDAPYMIEDVIRVDDVEPSPDALPIGPSGQDWHVMHFLLTGKARGASGPLANVILGGVPIGDDVGDGQTYYLTPEEVKATASALERISPAVLARRFNADALVSEEIYPVACWQDCREMPDYLIEAYEGLRNYYREAAANGDAMLNWIES